MSEIWPTFLHGLSVAGEFLAWTACILLCLGGLVLSAFSLSGTWLVGLAALGAAFLVGPGEFPEWPALVGMFAVCASVDIVEWFAASWGVRRRGGSSAAGWMALLGSIGGAILGGMVVPILGSLVGMMAGSFALVYWTERRRLLKSDHAAHIATGAVLAGISVLFLKVATTAGLVLWLAIGLLI
ncbi:MAG TPA: hypothetical protein DCM68_06710 [Verrucomicrobia bacterium]|nr:hypothetical protein [Verrucomicrobiota bacterium]